MIARRLGMTEGTVKVHVRQMMRKCHVSNRTQLAVGGAAVIKGSEGDTHLSVEKSAERSGSSVRQAPLSLISVASRGRTRFEKH